MILYIIKSNKIMPVCTFCNGPHYKMKDGKLYWPILLNTRCRFCWLIGHSKKNCEKKMLKEKKDFDNIPSSITSLSLTMTDFDLYEKNMQKEISDMEKEIPDIEKEIYKEDICYLKKFKDIDSDLEDKNSGNT